MSNELEIWDFIADRLRGNDSVQLLVVAESSGSSPGRAGYKMVVAADGELCGSIGGGVMEVSLVELAKSTDQGSESKVIEQVHQTNSPYSSGMICSGRQSVLLKELTPGDLDTVERIVKAFVDDSPYLLILGKDSFSAGPDFCGTRKLTDGYTPINFGRDYDGFTYSEELNRNERLYIVGGGHCALALSELMSKLDFRISIFDDRPELNTIEKNEFADEITIIENYEKIGGFIPNGNDIYVVVMTLGYKFDEIVIRSLFDHDLKYFGVLGSRAKMKTLLATLEKEGFDKEKLARIRTPIGLPISSQTPEEIAVSIAGEIIAVKNAR